ncbi:MAG: hypothetical protein RKO66_00825 [Candidatus Contendobacter sp.]|nr:hypothetical protein [Candidatus Contendobacter sp.]MDS4060301.1 hypothetical protein [Candidatus Contendobacter sp.]
MSATPYLQGITGSALFLNAPLELTQIEIGLFDANGNEASGTGYQRARCDPGPERWAVTQGNGKTRFHNQVPVVFPAPVGNWGTITQRGLYDASSNALLAMAPLDTPRVIEAGDNPPVFLAGELVFEIE